jgi:hypothetical protein
MHLTAAGHASQPGRTVRVPFYRLRTPASEWFLPALRGRNPRALWNLAIGLSRRAHDWRELGADLAAGSSTSAAGASGEPVPVVEVSPTSARALAPFLARLLDGEPDGRADLTLCWIALERHGPDLVEPGSRLGLPRVAVKPWDTVGASAPARPPATRAAAMAGPPAGAEARTRT